MVVQTLMGPHSCHVIASWRGDEFGDVLGNIISAVGWVCLPVTCIRGIVFGCRLDAVVPEISVGNLIQAIKLEEGGGENTFISDFICKRVGLTSDVLKGDGHRL